MSIKLQDVVTMSASINSIKTSSTELQALIHETAVSVLAHVRDHGDTTLAVRLVNAMSSGTRREGLSAWFYKFSGKTMNLSSKEGVWTCKLKPGRVPEDFDVEASMLVDFGDLTKEAKAAKALTIEDILKALKKFTNNDKVLADGVTPQVPVNVVKAAQRALAAIA